MSVGSRYEEGLHQNNLIRLVYISQPVHHLEGCNKHCIIRKIATNGLVLGRMQHWIDVRKIIETFIIRKTAKTALL